MPELPEVQTTVSGLQRVLPGLKILDVWSDLPKKVPALAHFDGTIKEQKFFNYFKKEVAGKNILNVERRAKNILINISGGQTILIHLKMTGHILVGWYEYDKKKNAWFPHPNQKNAALRDPFNKYIHFVLTFSSKMHLAFSDARKFGKVTLISTKEAHDTRHLSGIGPEPLDKSFTEKIMVERLMKKPSGKIKSVLMDQSVVAGIGNIYSDEILWESGIHPESVVKKIPKEKFAEIFKATKKLLSKGIDFGGDSMSDYRNIDGEPGNFQNHHNVYRRKGKKCGKKNCKGVIMRKVIGGRSAHFCNVHQKLF